MNRNRLAALLLVMVLAVMAMAPGAQAEIADLEGKLVILHTNDVHGRAVSDLSNGQFGYSYIASLKKQFIEQGASVLLLDDGDASQGLPIVNLSYGENAIKFMNAAGYDAMALGNHEFDWGTDVARQLAEIAEFPILGANVVDDISGEPLFGTNVVFDMPNGMKVGVFGIDTPETFTKAHPDKVKGTKFLAEEELYACAQAQVDELTAAGCDLIVCLGHLGISDESIPNRSYDVIENTAGIDLFIDGHSHIAVDGEMINDTLLVSTDGHFQQIGVVVYDGSELSSELMSVKLDDEVEALVNDIDAQIQEQLSAVFATTEVDLNGERDPGVRTEETNLGDFCTDAMLWAAQQAVPETVHAAINNGGGIRATIKAGDITMNDMKTVFPYGNVVVVLTLKGSEILEALEAATFSTPDAIGAFPQVSGIVYTIDTTVPYENGEQYPNSTYYAPANPGSRVTIQSIAGEPYDAEKYYNVATNDFSAAGGDTYYAFTYANQTAKFDTGVALEDALVNYVAEVLGGVITAEDYGEVQGRITVIK
ncbi:MAG: 5'-nucleotidase C-terminal domain-containing protein [Clostridia bacterium]|nr:5'-nucleotidase C-terminal domain-containing protein [Clostridia bacterium]